MMPVARSFASSQTVANPPAGGELGQISEANDCASPSRSRISARQLDELAGRLSDNDVAALELVGRLRLCSGAQLMRALWPESEPTRQRRSRRTLARLTDLRILDRLPRTIGGVRAGSQGYIYNVGPAGARLLARGGVRPPRPMAPGSRYLDHTLTVGELVVELMEAERAGRLEVIGEPETEPICWRPFTAGIGARLTLKPDLFVRVGVGSLEDRWFVEVDRATESPTTITRKVRVYLAHYRSGVEQAAHGVYPRVLWSVPDAKRARVVTKALAALPAEAGRLFTTCTQTAVVARLAEEAAS